MKWIKSFYFIVPLILFSCIKNKQNKMTEKDLMLKFSMADSLFLSGNKQDLAIYTRKELIPIFKYYSPFRKATILNYLVDNKSLDDILLAEKLIKANYQNIKKCDLVSQELIQYFNLITACKSTHNDSLDIEWDSIYASDQKYRNILSDYNPNDKEWDSLSLLLYNQDKSNRNIISKYIDSIGLKKIADSDCECKAIKTIFFVGLHSTDDSFRNLIISEFSKNNINNVSPKYLTYLIDRKLVLENKKQIYGTQMRYNKIEKKLEPCPIEDQKKVDILRFRNNLPSLQFYISLMNKSNN